jgi:hypothetical protein
MYYGVYVRVFCFYTEHDCRKYFAYGTYPAARFLCHCARIVSRAAMRSGLAQPALSSQSKRWA